MAPDEIFVLALLLVSLGGLTVLELRSRRQRKQTVEAERINSRSTAETQGS